MVLAGDVALASSQVEGRDIVGSVAILELDGASSNSQSKKLVTKADTHDGDGRGLHQTSKVVNSLLAMSWVTGAVGDEYTIKVLGNLVDGVVVREDGDGGTSANQAAQDVLLNTAVDKSDVQGGTGALDNEGSLGGDSLDKVDLAGINEALVLVGIVLVTNRDPSKGRTLLSEVGDDGTSVNTRDGGDTLAGAPLTEALDGSPMAVVQGHIGDDDTGTLDVGRLEVLEKVVLVTLVRGHTVVANQGLCKDQDLASVGGIRHGLRVSHKGGGEDGLARDVGVGTESLASEDGTIL